MVKCVVLCDCTSWGCGSKKKRQLWSLTSLSLQSPTTQLHTLANWGSRIWSRGELCERANRSERLKVVSSAHWGNWQWIWSRFIRRMSCTHHLWYSSNTSLFFSDLSVYDTNIFSLVTSTWCATLIPSKARWSQISDWRFYNGRPSCLDLGLRHLYDIS